MTDREYLGVIMGTLRNWAEIGPMSPATQRIIAKSIENHLQEERRGFERVSHQDDHKLETCPHGVIKGGGAICLQCADPAFHAASRNNPTSYQTFTVTGVPQSAAINQSLCPQCGEANFSIPRMGIFHAYRPKEQKTWRCAHYPSSVDNWGKGRTHCDIMYCDKNELRWWDNGTSTHQPS